MIWVKDHTEQMLRELTRKLKSYFQNILQDALIPLCDVPSHQGWAMLLLKPILELISNLDI
jgi:hypothetical protein